MSAATISTSGATLTLDIFRGMGPLLLRSRVDLWEIPGVNGYGVQKLAQGNGQFQAESVSYISGNTSNLNTATTLLVNADLMQGNEVTLVDNWGNGFAHILVHQVSTDAPDTLQPCIYNGDLTAIRVTLRWLLVRTNDGS